MVMPGLDGIDVAQAVLKLRPKVAVILMSGYADRLLDTASIGIEAHFLQKPFSLDALARLTRLLFDNGG
jgi:DNA-binding NtrC family response regulator